MKRALVMALSVILALAVAAPIASGQPANQRKGLKALTEAWWTWALAVPSPIGGGKIMIQPILSAKENL